MVEDQLRDNKQKREENSSKLYSEIVKQKEVNMADVKNEIKKQVVRMDREKT